MSRFELYTRLAYAAMVICIGLLLVQIFLPKPNAKTNTNRKTIELNTLKDQTKTAFVRQQELQTSIETRVWRLPTDQIGPRAMSNTEALAKQNLLTMNAFRPQRTEEEAGLERLAYTVTVEGPFPKVVSFVRALETPKTQLAVKNVQIASADGASDAVTATIGLVAYRQLKSDDTQKP